VRRGARRDARARGAAVEQDVPDMLPSERDPSLLQQNVGWFERFRLNHGDAFYRGSGTGSAYLATLAEHAAKPHDPNLPPDRKLVGNAFDATYARIAANLVRYDLMDPFATGPEAAAAFLGQFTGSLPSLESFAGVPAKAATTGHRIGKAVWQQSLIDALSSAIRSRSACSRNTNRSAPSRRSASAPSPEASDVPRSKAPPRRPMSLRTGGCKGGAMLRLTRRGTITIGPPNVGRTNSLVPTNGSRRRPERGSSIPESRSGRQPRASLRERAIVARRK